MLSIDPVDVDVASIAKVDTLAMNSKAEMPVKLEKQRRLGFSLR